MSYVAQITVKECHDLKSADRDGTSDPFVKVYTEGNRKKGKGNTRHISNTLDPVFTKHNKFNLQADDGVAIYVEVWDHDRIGKDFLGIAHFVCGDVEEGDLVLPLGELDGQEDGITGTVLINYTKGVNFFE
eukprot:TRINITY_DN11425_c0_g1_i1.p1 TRINITY_DN11425_c0_g1~~TRINITY_DN11425_c0_g1_i1.p1  ORF type:complete len:141 (+),score=35.79 TRINITY_DN11425_c0_g1_i1:32-424(+)